MCSYAQIEKVEPPNWWVGFEEETLQLLVYGPGLGDYSATLENTEVNLSRTTQANSPNYLFLDLEIPKGTKEQTLNIIFKSPDKKQLNLSYQLLSRIKEPTAFKGFSSEDAIYLITPDRFANGDKENDAVPGMKETGVDRNDDYARHGGDIQGILNHLNYIKDMGFTAIWSSPLLENDMPQQSYHGYAITDFYRVDPRFGNLKLYKQLSEEASKLGMKIIMDQVVNHCGLEHWWMKDLPFHDWVNEQQAFEERQELRISNHRRTTNQDISAAEADKTLMANGWFVSAMPDLNQQNQFLSRYLIQNSIWWIETLHLGGIRQDTYPYPDKSFMAKWAGSILREYPNFSIVGEEWSYNPLLVGYWQRGSNNRDGYESNLKCTMDFPLQNSLVEALNEPENWDKGLIKLYEALANDFHYASPKDLLMFADNHDMDRIYTQFGEDEVLTEMAMAFILMAPRIPQIYYGTEILIQNSAKPGDHGLIRTDFPGGWEGDTINAFEGTGLSEPQKKMQQFLKKLLRFREGNEVIHHGKTKHFAPQDGVYVLFRYMDNKTIVLILNKNSNPVQLSLSRFREMNLEGQTMKDLISEKEVIWSGEITLDMKGAVILTNY